MTGEWEEFLKKITNAFSKSILFLKKHFWLEERFKPEENKVLKA